MAAKDILANEFNKEVLDSPVPVLVDFWAPWCVPCIMMAPTLDDLSEQPDLKEKMSIKKINTEIPQNQPLAIEYDIRSIPNMKLFYRGKVVKDFIGLRPHDVFKSELQSVLKSLN